jgi:hypothetical protein
MGRRKAYNGDLAIEEAARVVKMRSDLLSSLRHIGRYINTPGQIISKERGYALILVGVSSSKEKVTRRSMV